MNDQDPYRAVLDQALIDLAETGRQFWNELAPGYQVTEDVEERFVAALANAELLVRRARAA